MRATIGKDKNLEFGDVVSIASWTANARMVDKFGQGRVYIAGDAAHIHSPTGAQGLNSGIQDCFNLAWKLSLAHKYHAPRALLDSYTTERIPVISAMLNFTTELMRRALPQQGTTPGMVSPARRFDIRQFGINYRGSPIVLDERYESNAAGVDPYRDGHDGAARAGDRAPEAPGIVKFDYGGQATVSLYDLLDVVSHTVLVFGDSPATAVADVLRSIPAGVVKSVVVLPQGTDVSGDSESTGSILVVDREGYAYRHYHAKENELLIVVIRPDGYIGAAVKGDVELKGYFETILGRVEI
ncbi:hypothetical protein V5O48_013476 [Marasmius crinis-equi]|uniref:FAD-binding domain-containing protein n=1 Tax=Marasmius crinis-equi TaxID=585013 RepID=A0ABR3EZZ8_9AGAR